MDSQKTPSQYIYLGAIQGAVAWSAYALLEFASSSVMFRLLRPYAQFTEWHWQITALLIVAYLVTGIVLGGCAGLLVFLLRGRTRSLRNADIAVALEGAAVLSLLAAFTGHILTVPHWPSGKLGFIVICVVLSCAVIIGILSAQWSERLGLLANPWVISGLLLGVGQGVGYLQLQDLGSEFGVQKWLLLGLLAGLLTVVAAAAIVLGRWLRPRLVRDKFMLLAPGWAALGLAVILVVGSLWLGERSMAKAQSSTPGAGSTGQPNVLIVVMDTVRADHLSLYGYGPDTTPNLKKLAHDSTVYTNAIAPSDMTLTSHASLFTGLYGSWHGAHCQWPEAAHGRALNPNATTLAEIFAAKGYSTVGVAANLYLRANFGLQRGFQTFEIPRPVPVLGADESWYLLRVGMRHWMNSVVDTSQFDRLFSRGDDINRELYSVLNTRAGGPFFAFINYMDAHYPYLPPAPYDHSFPGKDRRILPQDMDEAQNRVLNGQSFSEHDHSHMLSQYDGGIAYIDAQIGHLTSWLKERNLYDNTLLVITSDHGEAFGEKNLVLHGNSVYQNLVHVALMIKYPKNGQTGVVDEPVSLIDVAPTILTSVGFPADPKMQGRNLLNREPQGKRDLFTESFQCPVPHPPDCPAGGCSGRAVLAWPYKLVTSSAGKRELYDVSTDPDEKHDLAAEREAIASELGSQLKNWAKTMPARPKQQLHLDGESIQRLKSLGYVQ